jgi:hypothetical protein
MSVTFPTVVINYITYTAKRWGQFPTISYSNGAIAGSEVVTVDSSLNINIQIQDGVTTNAQIKTAIEATTPTVSNLGAGDLVSVAITSGHNADTNVTVKNAALAGGTVAAKASLAIGHLVYVAKTAGVAGNSIRVKYTSGGSLSVSVATNDITIQLKNDGSSTNALIAAAVVASGPADALVDVKSDGLAMSFVPTAAIALAFLNLSGGTDAAVASVELQDLTYAADLTGISRNGKTISYTTGASAGAEVVTVSTAGNITIQIENGVSLASEIKTAFDASAGADGLAATGSIVVSDYAGVHLLAATGSITINNNLPLQLSLAWADCAVVDYTELSGAVFTIAGHALVEGVDWTASDSNDVTAASIAEAANLLPELAFCYAFGDLSGGFNIASAVGGIAANSITLATSNPTYLSIPSSTLLGGQDAATLTVAGHVLTESIEWGAAGTVSNTCASLTAAIEALSEVTVINAEPIIYVIAATPGSAGNSITLVSSDPTNMAVTSMAGGQDGAIVTIAGHALTESVEWLASVDNDTTATSLASAINALTEVNASASTDTVNIVAAAKGPGGNAVTLATSDAIRLLKSGNTLTGGNDAYSCTVSGSASAAQKTVNAAPMTGAVGLNGQGFYSDQSITALTSSFVQFDYPFISRIITIANDDTSGSNKVVFSFDGTNVHGTLGFAQAITWDVTTGKVIWLKYDTGAPKYRLIVKGD